MNKIFKYGLTLLLGGLLISSCKFDNYDEPEVPLEIKVTDGDRVLNTSHGELFRLYQYVEDGYVAAGSEYIPVNVNQEGDCKALLFPGRYKLVVNPGGKVRNVHYWNDFPRNAAGAVDTFYFDLGKGGQTLKFDVTPYLRVNDFKAVYRNDSIVANFSLEQPADILSKEDNANNLKVRSVALLVSPTNYVNNEVAKLQSKGSNMKTDGTVNQIRCHLKGYYGNSYYVNNYRDYAYVRIAIALRKDATEYIYSNIIKVEGIPQETINKFK